MKLLVAEALALCRLPLQDPQRPDLTLLFDHLLHCRDAQRPDQLVLEIGIADEEAQPLQVETEAGPRKSAPEPERLSCIAQAGQSEVRTSRAEPIEKAPDVRRPAHRHDGDSLRVKIAPGAGGQRLDGALVTDTLDEDHRVDGIPHAAGAGRLGRCRVMHPASLAPAK